MKKLTRAGFEVYVEAGAGLAANYADQAYTDAGAHVVSRAEALACENIVCIRFPGVDGIGSGTNLAVSLTRFGIRNTSKHAWTPRSPSYRWT